MATKKSKPKKIPKKVEINPPENSPMDNFHQAMKKIVSVPKKDLKDK
jgi:hypothetical protein